MLACDTFFSDWCYVRPCVRGRELCDLLVVFDDVAIIWQVKNLKLACDGYYKVREVDKNVRQLAGAMRSLLSRGGRINLENSRRDPEELSPENIREIYLISVLLGPGEPYAPLVYQAGGIPVHAFDEEFTEIALQELDTVSDFVRYLRSKEAALAELDALFVVGGEKELLGLYLSEGRSLCKLTEARRAYICGDYWRALRRRPEYIAKCAEDRISYYIWDRIIDILHECGPGYERLAREMARPNRFDRRVLSRAFFEKLQEDQDSSPQACHTRNLSVRGTSYCFLFTDASYPRRDRRAMLAFKCDQARSRLPQNPRVLGIAAGRSMGEVTELDYLLLDAPEWTAKDQADLDEVQRRMGGTWQDAAQWSRLTVREYPRLAES